MITFLLLLITIILGSILYILIKYIVLIVEEKKEQERIKQLRIKWEQEQKESRIKAKKFNQIK